jgi:hypothetical protein
MAVRGGREMPKNIHEYSLWAYDLVGNDIDGYEVNDRAKVIEDTISIFDDATDWEILEYLHDRLCTGSPAVPFLARPIQEYSVDGDQDVFFISWKDIPCCELVREGNE